eukprot:Gb_28775 [translate_table: standard]
MEDAFEAARPKSIGRSLLEDRGRAATWEILVAIMTMAMANPSLNQGKKTVLFLTLHKFVSTLASNTTSQNRVFIRKPPHDNNSGGLKSLCKQGRLKEALGILHLVDHRDIRINPSAYDSLLQCCVHKKALPEGKLVHAHTILTGFNPDISSENKLLTMYAKCGSLVDARLVLDHMPERNVVSCTAMIAAYSKHGYDEDALGLFYQMQRNGIQPDQFTFSAILSSCASLGAMQQGKEIHEKIVRSGVYSDLFVGSALVDMYIKCGSLEQARHVFDKMPERNVVSWTAMVSGYAQKGHFDEALVLFQKMPDRNMASWNAMITGYAQNGYVDKALKFFQKMPQKNVVSWNAMIAAYTQNGNFDEAMKLYREMQLKGVKPNEVTFPTILPACANLAALEHGKEIHEDIIKSGLDSDIFVGNALVDMYAKCGSIEEARNVFDKMPRQNVVSWTTMITGYAMHGCGKEALHLFEQMQHSGTKPNYVTFIGVLSACCHAGLMDDGWHYFGCMSRDYHIIPSVEHYSCMVDLLGRAGRLDEAQDFINKMPMKPDATLWGSLLAACRIHNYIAVGERVAKRLLDLDPQNAAHYVLLSNIYAAAGRWDEIEKVRKIMKDRKVKKMPGCSWIEVNNKMYTFFLGDRSHPQTPKIYAELERLLAQMKEAGYVPDTNFVLHDVEEEQKEHVLCYHSEKLAIAFGLLNTSCQTPIRIVKNLRVCVDCHSAIKFISKIVAREIVVRDAKRFHHFKDGGCSCGNYW